MASDFGDESGEKMYDNLVRFGERMGIEAMRGRAYQMRSAFDNAKGEAGAAFLPWEKAPTEWAKLDMREFQSIDDYEGIKTIITAKLDARGLEATWFPDQQAGKEYLLFRIVDAQEVWRSFDELSKETDEALSKATEDLKEQVEKQRDVRPLEDRAKQAREASKALEKGSERQRAKTRDPNIQQARNGR